MNIAIEPYYLSPIQEKDAWKICNFAVSNEDRLQQYFPQTLEQNLTPDLAKNFAKRKTQEFELRQEFLYTIKDQLNNELVGLIYLKELHWDTKQGEFAYAIGYQFVGKGIASKATRALADYAFEILDLKILQIFVHRDNIASVMVAKKCGFEWKETVKNKFTPRGRKPIDMELYELYNEK